MPDLDLPDNVPPGAYDPATHHETFGTLPMLVPPAIPFPRDAMQPTLDAHARLLRRSLDHLLHEFVDPDLVHMGMPFDDMAAWAPILTEHEDGEVSSELLLRQMSSWVVRRCHGIARELMESPRHRSGYVVIVARGVAALHRVIGTGDARDWEPDKRYSYEGLALKPVGRPVAAEPWEQWHGRRGSRMTTYWSLPDGPRGQGDVEIPVEPRTVHERVERTLAFHADSIANALARIARERRGKDYSLLVTNTKREGFRVVGRPFGADVAAMWVSKHPTIRRLLARGARGFAPVYVKVDHGAGLRWVPRGRAEDRQVPRVADERDADGGE